MWDPETDACACCMECEYFLDDYWNCQGDIDTCWEFLPKRDSDSKYKKDEIEVDQRSSYG